MLRLLQHRDEPLALTVGTTLSYSPAFDVPFVGLFDQCDFAARRRRLLRLLYLADLNLAEGENQ